MDSATLSDSTRSFNRDPEEFAGENDSYQCWRFTGKLRRGARLSDVNHPNALPAVGCRIKFVENGELSAAAASGSRLNDVTSCSTAAYMDCIAQNGAVQLESKKNPDFGKVRVLWEIQVFGPNRG